MHLLAVIALYFSAGSFITLIFQYINVIFPDTLVSGAYYLRSAYGAIRWAIASLVVSFPIFVFTSWFLEKEYAQAPAKRNLRVRRWLVYFTLFAAAVIIAGDIVALIYSFLGGELTIRFFLKSLTVLAVSAAVFGYYFYDIRKHKTE